MDFFIKINLIFKLFCVHYDWRQQLLSLFYLTEKKLILTYQLMQKDILNSRVTNQEVIFMGVTLKIPLISSEITGLWNSYMSDTMIVTVLKYFLNNVEDSQTRDILQKFKIYRISIFKN